MNSTVDRISDDDDDDGIDWVAACEEIDVVFQNSNLPSTSSSLKPPIFVPRDDVIENKKRNGTSRQSTLDKFVVKAAPRPPPPIPDVPEPVDDTVAGVQIDPEAARTWIYPVNVPLRDYQFAITKTALFSNTLVALPTGLGKTLIAAVVMFNYFRWFPEGKIVFAAPSRPLVTQQIEACHNIVGIPQDLTIDMTGQITPPKRACYWKSRRVFFVTPQVLEKDIESGRCLAKHMVCLVIDEAHRALGNYASSSAVRELMAVPVQLRILALTATPGSKQQTIQQIIDNLHISTLEYRNESDDDVSKYVHNRKIELIQVPMGQDAVEIDNKLLEVIHPYFQKLCSMRVIQNRDYKTLSPCEILNSREKFRQAPPQGISDIILGDAEGYFGVLLTLYHIRKLLSSHGIRPAHEMLEEKLKQRYFARYLSRNEHLFRAKLIMEQNLDHKAPSPKLSKMLEVLLDHFKTKDPENSRVIIFSNFRGSVRDIMDTLGKIGSFVRATQFIGQSSGKTSKGQSQKVQQAVLEKFRAGGYNVIVATSIGEEGLDIMEVDLVICFDANISPLRMIQRMGRTGRKHDGRVVVLACEGPELKGYMRKQANSKTVGKHMRNGGQVASIFIPVQECGKKVKDDDQMITPLFQEKLTDAESDLIAKYFHQTSGNTWKPSLIAFPHFQTFPSRVHKVKHSFKTGLLIDAMQRLEGLSFGSDSKISLDQVGLEKDLEGGNVEKHENGEDLQFVDDFSNQNLKDKLLGSKASTCTETLETKAKPSVAQQSPDGHSYLFGPDFISVDAFGYVLILSVPLLTSKGVSHPTHTRESSTVFLNCLVDEVSFQLNNVEHNKDLPVEAGAVEDLITSQTGCPKYGSPRSICDSDALQERAIRGVERVSRNGNLEDEDCVIETPDAKIKASTLLPDKDSNDSREIELSPRLTNMIKSGVVPESPVVDNGLSTGIERSTYLVADPASPVQLHNELPLKSSSPEKNEIVNMESNACGINACASPIKSALQTPLLCKDNTSGIRCCTSTSPIVGKSESPLVDLTNDSCSKNWCLSVGEKSESVKRTRKFKRLRKVADNEEHENLHTGSDSFPNPRDKLARSFTRHKLGRGRKLNDDVVRAFIDEEAEVSTDCDASDDEEDDQNDSPNDSFIDDRTCPTNAATQSATRGPDMMAIYRRSLLSQSPMPRFPSGSDTSTPQSMAPTTRTSETGSGSRKASFSLQTPFTDSANQSTYSRDSKPSFQTNHNPEAVPCTTGVSSIREGGDNAGRKRKLTFCPTSSVPAINLEKEFQRECEMACDDDDEFFDDIDFDAIEAQATLLLKQKSESTTQKHEVTIPPQPQSPSLDFPSFDLGIW